MLRLITFKGCLLETFVSFLELDISCWSNNLCSCCLVTGLVISIQDMIHFVDHNLLNMFDVTCSIIEYPKLDFAIVDI